MRPGTNLTAYTIGYEGMTIEAFVASPCAQRIAHLLDIREATFPRKQGFSKSALSGHLERPSIRCFRCFNPSRHDRYRLSRPSRISWPALAETLKALDVPVSVIADIDVMSEADTLKQLLEVLGGDWSEIETNRAALTKVVEAEKPPLNAEQIKGMITKELDAVGGTSPFPKATEQSIKRIFKAVSPWSALKRAGRNALNGTGIKHFDALVGKCATVGLWVVPEGELEGWCRSIEAPHGPSFAEKVLEERDVEHDLELQGARDFMKKIWQIAKKSGQ